MCRAQRTTCDGSCGTPAAARAGFTLFELILVMVLLCVIAGIVAPSMRNFGRGQQIKDFASQVLSSANYARTQAVSEGRIYRLNFNPTERTFWLTAQDGGAFEELGNDFGRIFTLPEGCKLEVRLFQLPWQQNAQVLSQWGDNSNSGAGSQAMRDQLDPAPSQRTPDQLFVTFRPNGRTDPATIRLTSSENETVDIACASATEAFRILTDAEKGAK